MSEAPVYSAEQVEAIVAERTAGLVAKNKELLAEVKHERAKRESAADEARRGALEAEVEAALAQQLATAREATNRIKAHADRAAVRLLAVNAVVDAGGTDCELLVPHLEPLIRHDVETGQTVVIDDGGTPRPGVTVAQLAAQLRERYPKLFTRSPFPSPT